MTNPTLHVFEFRRKHLTLLLRKPRPDNFLRNPNNLTATRISFRDLRHRPRRIAPPAHSPPLPIRVPTARTNPQSLHLPFLLVVPPHHYVLQANRFRLPHTPVCPLFRRILLNPTSITRRALLGFAFQPSPATATVVSYFLSDGSAGQRVVDGPDLGGSRVRARLVSGVEAEACGVEVRGKAGVLEGLRGDAKWVWNGVAIGGGTETVFVDAECSESEGFHVGNLHERGRLAETLDSGVRF